MSRIGKKPIELPSGVSIVQNGREVRVSGPKGSLLRLLRPEVDLVIEPPTVVVRVAQESRKTAAFWGLTRALIARMVEGVSQGFEKKLEIEGIGYRATVEGGELVLIVGFSHPVRVAAPAGIVLGVEKNTITISGIDQELVGDITAKIRHIRPPEPYKGKGIRYVGEVIKRKAGKKAVASA